MFLTEEIKKAISKASADLIPADLITLEKSPDFLAQNFDLSFPAGFIILKASRGKVKGDPLSLAQGLADKINSEKPELIESAQASKPGYVNLKLAPKVFNDAINLFLTDEGKVPGFDPKNSGLPQSVLLEFVSVNPTGPLHFGHVKGSILGDTLARLFSFLNVKVVKEYYINDVGGQIEKLGASLQAYYKREVLGVAADVPEGGYQGDYLKDMALGLSGDSESWQAPRFAEFAMEKVLGIIKSDLSAMEIIFDIWARESVLHDSGKVGVVLDELEKKGCAAQKDGALWFVDEAKGKEADKECVLRKSDGRPTYLTSDLAYHREKFLRGFDCLINIWGADHHGAEKRLRRGLKSLGIDHGKLKVILVQMVRLVRDGNVLTMSKREGSVISAIQVLDEVGRDSIRFFMNLRTANAQMDFDLDFAKKKNTENPVYLTQYAHARVCSITKECEKRGVKLPAADELLGVSCAETDQKAKELKSDLLLFWNALLESARDYSTHQVALYLVSLARSFHSYYETHSILHAPSDEVRSERLKICLAAKAAIKTGLGILGVSAPEKM
ncbi:arginine--tRNA ligase [Elusimicrobiota bacterium]